MTSPGVRGPVFGWAARYASLAINADRLYRRKAGHALIAYNGPQARVSEWEHQPVPDITELAERLTSC